MHLDAALKRAGAEMGFGRIEPTPEQKAAEEAARARTLAEFKVRFDRARPG